VKMCAVSVQWTTVRNVLSVQVFASHVFPHGN
jgi:hypothetical protein